MSNLFLYDPKDKLQSEPLRLRSGNSDDYATLGERSRTKH